MTNPLLETHTLPPFSKISPEHVEPAITQLMEENLQAIEQLLDKGEYSWETLIEPLEALEDRLNKAWSPVSHMNSVVNTPELRDAYNSCLPKLAEYGSKIGQNKRLYEAYVSISKSSAYQSYDPAQKKVITNALRDFKLAGVALEGEAKQAFTELKQKLSKLQSQFSDHVMDATDNWSMVVETEQELSGLPALAIKSARERAEKDKVSGYKFGLDFPSYQAIITYAQDRELRRRMYEAFVTRASDQGPDAGKYDNSTIINEILDGRTQVAKLLGFNNYAEYSLATKMANEPSEVLDFLQNLATQAKPFAQQDYDALKAYVKDSFGIDDLKSWDIAFYSEKLRKEKYNVSQEELRPYFPHTKVMQGMFEVIHRLYGMQVKPVKGVDCWHHDVDFYEVYDAKGALRGQFYFDLFARPHKRSGAWMDECRVRWHHADGLQLPVAYLTCNFTPPDGDKPSLLTHDEVLTLFHEFGHGLHHVLTQVNYPAVSGINGVPWDAVELPSQFMENWCWEEEALALISGHHETGEPLPQEMLKRLKDAKNFQSGLFLIRQLEFGLFDFRLHQNWGKDGKSVMEVLQAVRDEVSVIPVPEFNRFSHSFSHIFAGGYAAGYYSYLWAELLSCDAFSRFAEEGIFNQTTGQSFLAEVLEKGGSYEPSELFRAFRGRDPQIDALLKEHGLKAA